MKQVFVIFVCFIGGSLGWGGYRINFQHRDLEYDESLMNLDVNIKRRDDRTVVNVRGELFEDIKEPIYIHMSHYEKDGNGEFKHLANVSVNACNILSRVKAHPILKLIVKELLKSSNMPTACPVKKGIYYMKDFVFNEDILPPFLPIGEFMSYVRMSRVIDDEDMTLASYKLMLDIDYAKDRKAIKFFK